MLSYFQAAILGILQGISELFPISSLGHSILLPAVLGWSIDQNASYFLTFLVATHFATAAVLFFFYWSDWLRIISGILRSIRLRRIAADPGAKTRMAPRRGHCTGRSCRIFIPKAGTEAVHVALLCRMLSRIERSAALRCRASENKSQQWMRRLADADERIAKEVSWVAVCERGRNAGSRFAPRVLTDGIDDCGRANGRVGSRGCAPLLLPSGNPDNCSRRGPQTANAVRLNECASD